MKIWAAILLLFIIAATLPFFWIPPNSQHTAQFADHNPPNFTMPTPCPMMSQKTKPKTCCPMMSITQEEKVFSLK